MNVVLELKLWVTGSNCSDIWLAIVGVPEVLSHLSISAQKDSEHHGSRSGVQKAGFYWPWTIKNNTKMANNEERNV